jgi:hypothetical protein
VGAPTLTEDVVLVAAVLASLLLAALVAHVAAETVRALAPARPLLPEEDRAPAGLGRLVPAGAQLEAEVRSGLVALELWLAASRRGRAGGAPRVPVQRRSSPADAPRRSGRSTAADGG